MMVRKGPHFIETRSDRAVLVFAEALLDVLGAVVDAWMRSLEAGSLKG
jgi:hypothetical protein